MELVLFFIYFQQAFDMMKRDELKTAEYIQKNYMEEIEQTRVKC